MSLGPLDDHWTRYILGFCDAFALAALECTNKAFRNCICVRSVWEEAFRPFEEEYRRLKITFKENPHLRPNPAIWDPVGRADTLVVYKRKRGNAVRRVMHERLVVAAEAANEARVADLHVQLAQNRRTKYWLRVFVSTTVTYLHCLLLSVFAVLYPLQLGSLVSVGWEVVFLPLQFMSILMWVTVCSHYLILSKHSSIYDFRNDVGSSFMKRRMSANYIAGMLEFHRVHSVYLLTGYRFDPQQPNPWMPVPSTPKQKRAWIAVNLAGVASWTLFTAVWPAALAGSSPLLLDLGFVLMMFCGAYSLLLAYGTFGSGSKIMLESPFVGATYVPMLASSMGLWLTVVLWYCKWRFGASYSYTQSMYPIFLFDILLAVLAPGMKFVEYVTCERWDSCLPNYVVTLIFVTPKVAFEVLLIRWMDLGQYGLVTVFIPLWVLAGVLDIASVVGILNELLGHSEEYDPDPNQRILLKVDSSLYWKYQDLLQYELI